MKEKQLYAIIAGMNFMIREIYETMINTQIDENIKENESKIKTMQQEMGWLQRDIAYESNIRQTKLNQPNKVYEEFEKMYEEDKTIKNKENK